MKLPQTSILFLTLACCWELACCDAKPKATPAIDFNLIADDLYQDQKGNLYFRVLDESESVPVVRFRSEFGPSGYELKMPLKSVINAESWKRLHETIYTDGTKVYCHHITAGGGWLLEIDHVSYKDFAAIVTNFDKTQYQVDIAEAPAQWLSAHERIWYYTDGSNVIDHRCNALSPIADWRPN